MKKLWFLVVWFLGLLFLGNGAFADYTQVFSDDFNRADSGNVGNWWIAPNYQLLNQVAISNFTTWGLGSNNPNSFLLRPISESESIRNSKIGFTTVGNPAGAFKSYYILSRYQNNQAYVAVIFHQYNTMSIRVKTASSGLEALTTLISTGITMPWDGILSGEFSVQSVSDTKTLLTFTLYDSSGTLVDTLSIEDSTPALQTTGQIGFAVYDSKGILGWDNITIASNSGNDTNDNNEDQPLHSSIIGFIGDSITAANTAVVREITNLGNGLTAINRGVGATSTRSWLLGYDGSYSGSPLLPPALTAFQNSWVQVVQIMLGTNDSSISRNVLPDEYKSNLQTMVDGLKSIGVKKIILNRPPYVLPTAVNHDDQALVKMAGYMEAIRELVDGETVLLGDIEAYNYFETNQNQLSDGIHPTPAGYQQLGTFWAEAYTRLLIDPYESGFAQFITNGNQHTWNTDTTLIYEVQKELSRFTMTGFAGVEIDGTELSGENYLADGTTATTITLKADYLNTLSTGDHLLTVRFSDGIITTGNFIIVSAPSNPTNPTNPSWWGWGGSSASKDNCPNGDFSPSYYDGECGTPNEQETTTWNNTENPASNDKVGTGLVPVRDEGEAEGVVNQEILTAYQFAYAHNITTLAPIINANPDGTVIRGHLAKMVVNYAINALWRTLPEKVPSQCHRKDGSNAWESQEMKDYAVKACSLGLMGIDMDYFQPYAQVSRAQFGTVLSRLLYGNEYVGGKPYYAKHLQALKEKGILTQIEDPEARVELRQWVRLMLMRSAK